LEKGRDAKDSAGIYGAIMARNPAHQTPVNILDVPSVSEYSEGVEAGGGQIAMPKMAVLGVGYVAYCRDLAGNGFGIFQGDEGAA
jgi:predicted enzyme related to lactoylglutathione lyase